MKKHWTQIRGYRTQPRYDVQRKFGLVGKWVIIMYKNQGPYTHREAAAEARRRNELDKERSHV